MRETILSGALAITLATIAAFANGLSDASAGMNALNQGNYPDAVHLFTEAIKSGELSGGDLELAYVKRAQAYIGEKRNDLALADLGRAQKLDPNDADIAALREQAASGAGMGASANARGGPTLDDTLDFISSKLSQQGALSYEITILNPNLPQPMFLFMPNPQAIRYTMEYSNLHFDVASCQFDFHYKLTNGPSSKRNEEDDRSMEFKGLESVQVVPLAQIYRPSDAGWGVQDINPPVLVLDAEFNKTRWPRVQLYFADEGIANRVAKAMLHAGELCGAKGEPF